MALAEVRLEGRNVVTLCIASLAGRPGKTALCAGIARKWQGEGKRVGFFKPLTLDATVTSVLADEDCAFLNEALALEDAAEVLCPIRVDRAQLSAASPGGELGRAIAEAYQRASRDKDAMLVEWAASVEKGGPGARLLAEVAGLIEAKLVVVLQYSGALLEAEVARIDDALRSRLIGVVVNDVPPNRMGTRDATFSSPGVTVFGVLPQERALLGITVNELARALDAPPATYGGEELVENVMLGAAGLDPGPVYFGRKQNKAVVVQGRRPDMQLAALETPTRVLVLTGGVGPSDIVKRQAEKRKVPALAVEAGTEATLLRIESALGAARFAQEKKLGKLDEMLSRHFDFKALHAALSA